MGAYFSKDPDDFQLLAKDPTGRLHMYTYHKDRTDSLKECTQLPFVMQDNVAYAFLSSTDKKWYAHVYADNICDITGNESVTDHTALKNKSVNTIKKIDTSNSNYFMMSNEKNNTPLFGILIDKDNNPVYAARSSFNKCIPMPKNSMPKIGGVSNNIKYDHNTVAMAFYTDRDCSNEYISEIPIPNGQSYTNNRLYNYNNRALDPERFPLPYTSVKAVEYSAPSDKTNAKYYRSWRPDYPDDIHS
jgi:hypothetical protein